MNWYIQHLVYNYHRLQFLYFRVHSMYIEWCGDDPWSRNTESWTFFPNNKHVWQRHTSSCSKPFKQITWIKHSYELNAWFIKCMGQYLQYLWMHITNTNDMCYGLTMAQGVGCFTIIGISWLLLSLYIVHRDQRTSLTLSAARSNHIISIYHKQHVKRSLTNKSNNTFRSFRLTKIWF